MELPRALPDELLLGRLIRYVGLSGESVRSFSFRVFGSNRVSIHPFLTAGISRLSKFSGEDAESQLISQTLAPLFFFYLPQHSNSLKKDLLSGDGAGAFRHSQLPSFNSGGTLYLKWCPICVSQDLFNLGVSYWHRSHQIPGITSCWEHQVRLMSFELKERQRLCAGFPPIVHGVAEAASDIENDTARFGFDLLTKMEQIIPTIDFTNRYRSRLHELDFITENGSVRRKLLMRELVTDLAKYPMQNSLFPRHPTDYHYISELLSAGTNCHPFRHLLLGAWLFKSVEKFFEYSVPVEESCLNQRQNSTKDELEQRCLLLLKQGYSLEAVYRETGKSRSYLKRLAAINGVKLHLKPKLLNDSVHQRIISLARQGVHRRKISCICGVGVGSVEQAISAEPGLVEWRKKCRFESKRRAYRVQILRYRQMQPGAMRCNFKSDCAAAFFWLYLRDREWLEQSLPEPKKACGPIGRWLTKKS
ncbi:TnsD family Tn7-like transposition protein [Rheinheimera faecalis]|uniref:TnsD family Tn7-like transposition protein n=1 Tax=Rheinheimera faecalis TaxID=2901141 RepID=UPI001E3B6D43|nr:TnsD family Tn7-like transposition protein [Rheinheimera faecalis]